jgi:hypothetical protein
MSEDWVLEEVFDEEGPLLGYWRHRLVLSNAIAVIWPETARPANCGTLEIW